MKAEVFRESVSAATLRWWSAAFLPVLPAQETILVQPDPLHDSGQPPRDSTAIEVADTLDRHDRRQTEVHPPSRASRHQVHQIH